MCGRFTLKHSPQIIKEFFELEQTPTLSSHYNIAPSQNIYGIRINPQTKQREIVSLRWGLIPSWMQADQISSSLINARIESVAQKPSFRHAFKQRRCLIPASGFYEWTKNGNKQPYYIHSCDNNPLAFAGLWEHWRHDNHIIESCTIITMPANQKLKTIHDRMPLLIPKSYFDSWLDLNYHDLQLFEQACLQNFSDSLEVYPVSTLVNSPNHDLEKCIEKI